LSLASPEGKSYTLAMPVEIVRKEAGGTFSNREFKKIAVKILELVGQSEAELSVALVNNGEIQKLNTKYRQKNYPTDVLSFPAANGLPIGVRLLGDVVISVEKAEEQAKQRGRTLNEEMVTLLIHGVLHLLGYDHERSAKDARIMGGLEKKLYRTLCEQGILKGIIAHSRFRPIAFSDG
jgi:probable rRNA maturation factor